MGVAGLSVRSLFWVQTHEHREHIVNIMEPARNGFSATFSQFFPFVPSFFLMSLINACLTFSGSKFLKYSAISGMHWFQERKPSAHATSKLNRESQFEGISRFSSEVASYRDTARKCTPPFGNC